MHDSVAAGPSGLSRSELFCLNLHTFDTLTHKILLLKFVNSIKVVKISKLGIWSTILFNFIFLLLILYCLQPMKHKLHPRLAKILGLHTETRAKVIEALWQYVKTHKLQDPHERDHINCDQYLEQVYQFYTFYLSTSVFVAMFYLLQCRGRQRDIDMLKLNLIHSFFCTQNLQMPIIHFLMFKSWYYILQVFHCKRMRFMEIPQRLSVLLQQPDPIGINHVITLV